MCINFISSRNTKVRSEPLATTLTLLDIIGQQVKAPTTEKNQRKHKRTVRTEKPLKQNQIYNNNNNKEKEKKESQSV